jgi:hypothetical protein
LICQDSLTSAVAGDPTMIADSNARAASENFIRDNSRKYSVIV